MVAHILPVGQTIASEYKRIETGRAALNAAELAGSDNCLGTQED